MAIEVDFMLQNPGGDYETVSTCVFEAVPRIGERVKLSGPEFGDESWKHKADDIPEGEQIFQVFDVVWAMNQNVEVFLVVEPTEQTYETWCACKKEVREEHGKKVRDDGVFECENCGHRQR